MFWVISVYFNIRNTLPKSGTFLLGHHVYISSLVTEQEFSNSIGKYNRVAEYIGNIFGLGSYISAFVQFVEARRLSRSADWSVFWQFRGSIPKAGPDILSSPEAPFPYLLVSWGGGRLEG